MTDDLNVFPNARSKLFGEGEDSEGIIDNPAVAGLSGSASPIATSPPNVGAFNAGFGGPGFDFDIRTVNAGTSNASISVTKSATQKAIITMFWFHTASTSPDWTLRNDTIVLFTFSSQIENEVHTDQFIDESASINPTYNISPVVNTNASRMFLVVNVIDIDDTHTGTIITPATATKQINTPDSHRTHEQAVLPG